VAAKFSLEAGADPGFQARGRGSLKKIAPSAGRRENCCGISCEKSRFYAKKSPLPSGFRGDDFLEINQSEKRIACGGHVC
jgi:hypothetical protein